MIKPAMMNRIKITGIISILFIQLNPLFAQWIPANGLDGHTITSFTHSGEVLFAGSSGGGVYRSTDDGANWEPVNNGLPGLIVWALAGNDSLVFAGTHENGLFISSNAGTSWAPTGLIDTTVLALALSDSNLFAGNIGGIFHSTDFGNTWSSVNQGLDSFRVGSLAIVDTNVFAGGLDGGVYLSTDNGKQWIKRSNGLPDDEGIYSFAVFTDSMDNINLYAGVHDVYHTSNNGESWSADNTGLPSTIMAALAVYDTLLFVGTGNGVFLSTDGTHWINRNKGMEQTYISSLIVSGSNIVAGASGSNIFIRSLSNIASVGITNTGLLPQFELHQNYPNPFNPITNISYSLSKRSFVSLRIYDILGNEIAALLTGERAPGRYTQQWDASVFPTGVYYYRLQVENTFETKKLLLLK